MYLHGTALIKQRNFTYLRLCRGVAFACHDHLVEFGTNVRHSNTYSLSKELLIYRQILCNILEITVVLITSFFYTVYEDARKIMASDRLNGCIDGCMKSGGALWSHSPSFSTLILYHIAKISGDDYCDFEHVTRTGISHHARASV